MLAQQPDGSRIPELLLEFRDPHKFGADHTEQAGTVATLEFGELDQFVLGGAEAHGGSLLRLFGGGNDWQRAFEWETGKAAEAARAFEPHLVHLTPAEPKRLPTFFSTSPT